MNNTASRRAFLKRASALSMAGIAAPWALNLAAMAEAAAATAGDYKALVCVFLYGGNDYANTLVPYDGASYAAYQQMRPSFAYPHLALGPTLLNPTVAPLDSGGNAHTYALAPELAPLLPLFDAGQLGVILNVGTLVQPTTKLQYTNKSVKLPPKLFSHNDQQSVWQSSMPEGATSGWGGRIGDLFESGNGNATFTCVNVSGNAVFMSGKSAVQYQVSTAGSVPLAGLKAPLFGSNAASEALRALVSQSRAHLLENEYSRVTKRSIDADAVLTGALASAPVLATAFPTGNSLADQLKMVARMIAAGPALGARRQVFFVSLGGFDNHDEMLTVHPGLLANVGGALAAFQKATTELGLADKVTTFTASDFGRTMSGNNDGSDHGWGSMHFVLGGAVKGQRFYGTAPVVANGGPDDVGQGRLLPTTSVDQLAATLGKWMGVSDSDLLGLLPSLVNYNAGARNLGFV
ncbi:MAG: Tat pathway signal protein [Massilia sp.]|nr:Tat pathway signal protein [Massilia sp.]